MENYTGMMENEYNAAVDYAAANLSQALAQNPTNEVGAFQGRPDVMDMKPTQQEDYVQRGSIIATNLREELSEYASTIEQQAISQPLLAQEAIESMPPGQTDTCPPVEEPQALPEAPPVALPGNISKAPSGQNDLIAEVNVQETAAEAAGEPVREEVAADPIEAGPQENSKMPKGSVQPVAQNSRKEEELDKNQCRVCTSKENLIDIFSPLEDSVISDKIQLICRTVKILERDFLPHFICNSCVDKLKIALEFKATCENTDRELRQKLKRSKNKVRRNTEFVIIDADVFSDSNSEEKKRSDDEEFHLSDVIESHSDSDSSYKGAEKPKKYKKRGRQPGTTTGQRRGRRPRNDVVFIAAQTSDVEETPETKRKFRGKSLQCQTCQEVFASPASLSKHSCEKPIKQEERDVLNDDDEDDEEDKPLSKRLKSNRTKQPEPVVHECKFCRQTFKNLTELKRHKNAEHRGEKPYLCRLCNKTFKLAQSLNGHLLRHENQESNISCAQCWKYFPNKKELRKHEMTAHAVTFTCEKCKRNFTSQTRLNNHRHQTCPGVVVAPKKRQEVEASVVGRDLFKCVAPMTSTYWSDSFSD